MLFLNVIQNINALKCSCVYIQHLNTHLPIILFAISSNNAKIRIFFLSYCYGRQGAQKNCDIFFSFVRKCIDTISNKQIVTELKRWPSRTVPNMVFIYVGLLR